MQFITRLSITLCFACAAHTFVLSAPMTTDKLTFLDKQGYEVISDAEEILTPVSPDKDNGVDLSNGQISNHEMLLYGRFYVLRKKHLQARSNPKDAKNNGIRADNILRNYPPSIPQPRILPPKLQVDERWLASRTEKHANKARNDQANSDSIYFPTEETTTKKYIRRRKEGDEEEITKLNTPQFRLEMGKKEEGIATTRKSLESPSFSGKREITSNPGSEKVQSSQKSTTEDNFDSMNSEEFVEWAKDNLSPEQISNLVHDTIDEVSAEIDYDTTTSPPSPEGDYVTHDDPGTEPKFQYNSLILLPGVKCPEGQHFNNHRGKCISKYVHRASPNDGINPYLRSNMNSSRRKRLAELLSRLKSMEAKVEVAVALEESEVT